MFLILLGFWVKRQCRWQKILANQPTVHSGEVSRSVTVPFGLAVALALVFIGLEAKLGTRQNKYCSPASGSY